MKTKMRIVAERAALAHINVRKYPNVTFMEYGNNYQNK